MRQKHNKFTALLLSLCLVLTMLPITALAQNAWGGTGLAEITYSSNLASLYAMGNNIVIQAAGDATTNLYYADVDGGLASAAIDLSGMPAIEGGASDISGSTTDGFDLSAISLAATYLGTYNSDTNAFADLDVVIWMQGGTLKSLFSGNINAQSKSITVHMSGGTLAGAGSTGYAIMANTIYISGGQIAGSLLAQLPIYLSGSPSVGTSDTGIEVAQDQFFYIDGALSGASVHVVPQANFADGTVIAQAADSYTITEGDIEQLHLIGDYAADKELYLENNQVKIRTATLPALSGDGTADSPYEIATAEDLMAFADLVNGGDTGVYAILMDDIDMSGKTWSGIALTEAAPYTGTFDGQGHTISNLTGTEGLFAYNDGTVQNVRVENANITREGGNLGVIAGVNTGTVSGCVTSGSVSGTGGTSWSIGGIAGWNNGGTVSGSISSCTVSSEANGKQTAGGLVGSNSGGGNIIASIYTGTAAKPVEGDGTYGTKTDVYYKDANGAWHKVEGNTTTDSTIDEAADAFNDYVSENGGYFALSQEGEILSAALIGDGTAENPYLIYTADQLKTFRNIVNGTLTDAEIEAGYTANTGAHGKLMANIILNKDFDQTLFGEDADGNVTYDGSTEIPAFEQWTPIGTSTAQYTGTFDGNDKTISGLYINDITERDMGLFGYLGSGGTIQKLTLSNSVVRGQECVGGIVGYSSGTIENCTNGGDVTALNNHAGGIAGSCQSPDGAFINCHNTGSVQGSAYVGGIAGRSFADITNCSNTGDVTGGTGFGVGGILGIASSTYSVSVTGCYNTGDITSTYVYPYVGGIVGTFQNQSARGTIKNCYNTGAVSATAAGSYYSGGLLGGGYCDITNCYNTGMVTGSMYVGAIGGIVNGTVENVYYLIGTADAGFGDVSAGAIVTEVSLEQMSGDVAQETMTGFDFTDTWGIRASSDTASYHPYLKMFGEETAPTAVPSSLGTTTIDGQTYFLIYTAEQLKTFRNIVNNTLTEAETAAGYTPDAAANGKLMRDITLNEDFDQSKFALDTEGNLTYDGGAVPETFETWTPIGNSSSTTQYTGTFDGNGKSISGLYINSSSYNTGLFGYLGSGGSIQKLTVTNSVVRGGMYTGSIVGYSYGTISECINNGDVFATSTHVGGIVGFCNAGGALSDCHNTGSVQGSGYCGGIAGSSFGNIDQCSNTGDVDGGATFGVGGIAGVAEGIRITNSYNTGSIASAANGNAYVGGILGDSLAQGCEIENCYNMGTVSASTTSGEMAGGIVGVGPCDVTNCYNTGAISGYRFVGGIYGWTYGSNAQNSYNTGAIIGGGNYVGGFAGYVGSSAACTIEDCYNTGSVTAENESAAVNNIVGGFVGYVTSASTVRRCYNTGDVLSTNAATDLANVVGGFVGDNASGTIENCYNTGNVTGENRNGGTSNVGGFAGVNRDKIASCWTVGQVSSSADGTNNVGAMVGNNYSSGTIDNCYYLAGTAEQGTGVNDGTGTPGSLAAEDITGADALTNMGLDDTVWTEGGNNTAWQYSTASEDDETLGIYTATGYLPQLSAFVDNNSHETLPLTRTGIKHEQDSIDGKTYYLIYTADQLATFRNIVNGSGLSEAEQAIYSYNNGACGRLMRDIDLNPGITFNDDGTYTEGTTPEQWTPIGNSLSRRYTGTFDGNGKTISGLYINNSSGTQGLFGTLYNGSTVKNLGIVNSYIRGNSSIGAVAGQLMGSSGIEGCYNTGAVTGSINVGGIAGNMMAGDYDTPYVRNCYNTGSVTGTTTDTYSYTGGIVGSNNWCEIANCYNTGTISGNGARGVSSGVTNCYYLNTCGAAGDGTSLTLAQMEDAESADGLLARLVAGSGEGIWSSELSSVGQWEYNKPTIQPILSWQTVVVNAPTYTVTIPEEVTADGREVTVSMTASALLAKQAVTITVAEDTDFNLYYGGDTTDDSIEYDCLLFNTPLSVGDTVLSSNNTLAEQPAQASLSFNVTETPRYAGSYSGTIVFTISIGEVDGT